MFEVTQGFIMDKFVVDLTNHNCSCYFWDLVGIPCKHVIILINYKLEQRTIMCIHFIREMPLKLVMGHKFYPLMDISHSLKHMHPDSFLQHIRFF